MRFNGFALVTSALVLAACGGEKKAETTPAAEPAAAPAAAPAMASPAAAAPAAAAGAAAPITGKTVEIKMIGDDKGYRFEPANVTISAGDGLKFVVVGGGPHNVAFDGTKLAADQKAQLDANMGADKMGELSSAMKMNAGDAITVSFGGMKPGAYAYNCTPHLAMGMKGVITVK
jgi:plastocyanin